MAQNAWPNETKVKKKKKKTFFVRKINFMFNFISFTFIENLQLIIKLRDLKDYLSTMLFLF